MKFFADEQPYEFSDLATYNSEVARGIVHTDAWKARMAERQRLFDERSVDDAYRQGWIVVGREPMS